MPHPNNIDAAHKEESMAEQKITQFSVPVRNQPGTLFRMAQILSEVGVNLSGIASQTYGEMSYIHFQADKDAGAVRRPLENAGYQVFENAAFIVECPMDPEAIRKIIDKLADEDVQIVRLYGTADEGEGARLVVCVDRPEKARAAFNRMGGKSR
jgi:hypothetical protein